MFVWFVSIGGDVCVVCLHDVVQTAGNLDLAGELRPDQGETVLLVLTAQHLPHSVQQGEVVVVVFTNSLTSRLLHSSTYWEESLLWRLLYVLLHDVVEHHLPVVVLIVRPGPADGEDVHQTERTGRRAEERSSLPPEGVTFLPRPRVSPGVSASVAVYEENSAVVHELHAPALGQPLAGDLLVVRHPPGLHLGDGVRQKVEEQRVLVVVFVGQNISILRPRILKNSLQLGIDVRCLVAVVLRLLVVHLPVAGGGGAAVVLGALQCGRPRRPGTPDGVLTELVRSEVEASSSSNVTALWLGQLRTHVDVSRQTVDDNPVNILNFIKIPSIIFSYYQITYIIYYMRDS